jgi:hypothetical protein
MPDSHGCTIEISPSGPRRCARRNSCWATSRGYIRARKAVSGSAWCTRHTASACTGGCTIPEVAQPDGERASQNAGPGK